MNRRQALLAAACAAAIAAAPGASAVTLFLDGPATVKQGDTVTWNFNFSDINDVSEVIIFHDVFVAFNSGYLKFKSADFSYTGIVSPDGQIPPSYFQTLDEGLPIGDYRAPPNGWTYQGPNYGNGSLRVHQGTDCVHPCTDNDLLTGVSPYSGQQTWFTAFSLTFEVIAQQSVVTTIALIDDTFYKEYQELLGTPLEEHMFDYKVPGGSVYPDPHVTFDVTVEAPVPAPLALVGLGLGLLGVARRFHPRA